MPDVIAIPTPVISPGGILDKRSKRNKLKDKLAQADAASGPSGSVLDAYVKKEVVKKVEPVPVPKVHTPPPVDVTVAASELPEVEDSWEVQATKIEEAEKEKEKEKEKEVKLPAPAVPAKRSLRPGGGVEKKTGNSGASKQNVIRYVFKKAEIMKLKPPSGQLERPSECKIFVNIVTLGDSNRQQGNNWKGQGGGHHNQGGSSNMQQQMMYSQQMSQHNLPQGGHGPAGSDAGWQRGQHQPPSENQRVGGRKNRAPAPPMVKKVITDPIEIMSREVTDILNKIAPQTFKKLTTSLSEIQVHDSKMLNTLVSLIFDKAITEPAYAMLYADMCQTLDAANKYANFFNVVFNKDTNQYFWIKDMEYTSELAGPYGTHDECINAVLADVPPPTVGVTHAVKLDKITVVNGILVSIIKSVDREEYFVSFIPNADVDESMKSPQLYSSYEGAYKSGLKKHSFQKTLVTICQDEYQMSTSNQGIYGEPAIRRAKLMERRSVGMDPEEYEALLEEVDMFEMGVKKRMMGNIRFIGELCKRKMIRTSTMHQCIQNLLDVKEGQKVDGGNVELVCKLLTSIGQKLDQDVSSSEDTNIVNSYYSRLATLRNSKSIYSRIKFSIDEVIELRRNNWVARIAQDGPATLEEIRKRALEDEERKAIAQQQLHSGHHYGGKGGKGGGGNNRGGPQDFRNSGRGGSNVSRNTSGGPSGGGRKGQDGNDRRSSGGGGENSSRGNKGGSRQNDNIKPTASPVPPKKKEMSPDLLKKRTATIVNEFISSGNEQEAVECLAELTPQACGFLVSNAMDKYLNSNKAPEKASILKLCSVVMSQLQGAASYVENAIKTDESLTFLCDFMMDVFTAPELMGEVLQVLIVGRAVRREVLNQRLAELRKINKDDDFGVPDEQLQQAHDRLLSKLK